MHYLTVAVYFILFAMPCTGFSQSKDFHRISVKKADSLRTLNEWDQAELTYRQALVFKKESTEAFKGLGKVAFAREDWPEFRQHFTKVLEISPGDAEAIDYLQNKSKVQQQVTAGDDFRKSKNYEEAKKNYEEALKLDGQYAEAYKGLGKIAYETSDWDNFNKSFKTALKYAPEDLEISDFLQNNPKYFEILNQAEVEFDAKEFEASEELYKEALDINPLSKAANRGLGRVGLQTKNWDEVKGRFKKIVKGENPADLEANYSLGIAYRETGKFKASLLKRLDFNKSRDYFKKVVAKDSTYEDVFYQFAHLAKLRENWFNAVELARTQVAVRADLAHANVGPFKFFRMLMVHEGTDKVARWLNKHPGDFADYMLAQQLRQAGKLDTAKSRLLELLNREIEFSKMPIYFSLIRLSVEQGKLEQADDYFTQALNSIACDTDAEFLFYTSKYIFNDFELEAYLKLSKLEHKKIFYRSFWTYRDPSPVAAVNARVIEHFRRLNHAEKNYWFDGVRSWANNPDKTGQLSYPAVYGYNDEINDKGLIYLRHGKPDDIAVTPNRAVSNESWLYYARQGRPKMMFHFIIDDKLGTSGNWQLTPLVVDSLFLRDRLGWDKKVDRLYLVMSKNDNQGLVEASALQSQIIDESSEVVKYGMSTDYHTWERKIEPISIPYHLVMQRGFGGKTLLELYCNIPLAELRGKGETSEQVIFKQGAGVYDRGWKRVTQSFEKVKLSDNPTRIYEEQFLQKYDFYLEPGTYHLSFFTSSENDDRMGSLNLVTEVPSFAGRALQVSDIIPAYDITPPVDKQAGFLKNDVSIIPNPQKEFSRSQPLFLYYEIYNLDRDEDKKTRYKIETQMTLVKKSKGGLGKVFGFLGGGKETSITIQHEREGKKRSASEFGGFDVKKLDKGEYLLTVKINDVVAGTSAEKSMSVVLN